MVSSLTRRQLATSIKRLFRTVSGFDGGDCCECTCVSTPSFTCGDGSHGDFDCIDPDAPCVDEDDDMDSLPANDDVSTSSGSTTSLSCIPDYFSDGICDFINNDEVCGRSPSLPIL